MMFTGYSDRDSELIYGIMLTLIKEVGPKIGRKLLRHFGSAASVFSADDYTLKNVVGLNPKLVYNILKAKDFTSAQFHFEYCKQHDIQILSILNDNYPKRLRNCVDAPLMLYYKGNADLNASKVISVVGTRAASNFSQTTCSKFVETFKGTDVLIISGLAYGIDINVHQACLANQVPTVGVLGHGLDKIYPSAHYNIAHKMLQHGGLLTEFLPGTSAQKENFPKRNRIIAGLCDALIVVEATIKGGALISAELANSYNRDVFAFPGRSQDVFAAGCNYLIKNHKAALITSAEDFIMAMA